MLKRLLLSIAAFLIILILITWLLPLDRYLPSMFGSGRRVLIVYDEPSPNREAEDALDALMLRQLVGHFPARIVDLINTGDYKKGQAKKYDIVFYMGTKQYMPVPSYLVDDFFSRKTPTVWINSNLDKFHDRRSLDGYGFRLVEADDGHGTNRVLYKGKKLWKLDPATYPVEIINDKIAKVYAWAFNEKSEYEKTASILDPKVEFAGMDLKKDPEQKFSDLPDLPEAITYGIEPPLKPLPQQTPATTKNQMPWIINGGNFWYVASNPFSFHIEGGAYLAFCDVLHDIFNTKVKEDHPALVRIEDVHANGNMEKLIQAADYLYEKKIPFHFTLIPVYANPLTGEKRYISSDDRFKETIHGLIKRGGYPVLHGYTHQWDGETAVDYEFWSSPAPGGGPVSRNSEYASERIIKALTECYLSGIYPISWTTPHYAAGREDYIGIRSHFTTVLERRQPIERIGSDQFFPYVIYRDMYHQIIFPEDLGYVQPTAGRDPKAILKDAENTLVVRDGWGSFFYHSFLDLNLLKQIVEGLQKMDYHFVNLAEYNTKVRTLDHVTISGVGEVDMKMNGQYLHEFTLKKGGRVSDETFSFRPITGLVKKYATSHPSEVTVYHGSFTRPTVSFRTLGKFRPFLSGITSPVSIFLLMIGMVIMLAFLVLWIFLLVRKTVGEIKHTASDKKAARR